MNVFYKQKFIRQVLAYSFNRRGFIQCKALLVLVAAFCGGFSPTAYSDTTLSQTPYCNNIFVNGLVTHGTGGHIQFERNARLSGTYNHQLNAELVTSDYYSPRTSCDTYFCIASTVSSPTLSLSPRDTSATHDVIVSANEKKLLNASITAYGRIDVGQNAKLEFSANEAAYTLNELNLGYKSTLKLNAGEYWIGNLHLEEGGKIEVVGEGSVNLYVINDLAIPEKFNINNKSRDASKLSIFTFGKINLLSSSKAHAFIYSLDDAKLDSKVKIVGSLIAKNIHLGTDSEIFFAEESLANLNFGSFCSGNTPQRDFTPPLIELDPFPYNTLTSSVTISGKITEPENGTRWLNGANIYDENSDSYQSIDLDAEGRFSMEMPLTDVTNRFRVSATDKSGNNSQIYFAVWREAVREFAIKLDYFEWEQSKPLPISGVISLPEGDVIESAFITTAEGSIPLNLINNRFYLQLPVVLGYNEYRIVARDQNGNEISEMVYINGLSIPVFEQVKFEGNFYRPERTVSGIIYSLWPLEEMVFSISGAPQELIPLKEGVYAFETEIILSNGRNRPVFTVYTSEGWVYEDYHDEIYISMPIFLTVEEPVNLITEVTSDTITVSGTLYNSLELIRKKINLVVISDRFPGIEYPVTTPGLSETGRSSFSIDIPLEPGENNLLVKVKQGKKDAYPLGGSTEADLRVIRN